MLLRKVKRITLLAASLGAVLLSSNHFAFADPDSAFFSESMIEHQDQQQRDSQPGGAWNSAKVNVPSYVQTGMSVLGPPIPGLDALTAGQGVIAPTASLVATGATNAIIPSVITAQSGAIGPVVGVGGGSGAGVALSAGTTATGAVLGALNGLH